MKVFGDVDRNKDGKIISEYPAWYSEPHVEELEEGIRHKEYSLENDLVPVSERGITKRNLTREKEKLAKIEESRPKLTAPDKDNISKAIKDTGASIKEAMFKRSDMTKGIADAHEEARRMVTPIIEIKSEQQAELAKACGINIRDGKVSRKEAEKMWKIGRRILGEPSNTEELRRD